MYTSVKKMRGLAIAKIRFDPYDVYDLGYEEMFEYIEKATVTNALINSSKTFLVIGEVQWKGKPALEQITKFQFFDEIVRLSHQGNRHIYMAQGSNLPYYSELIESMTSEFQCFFEYPLVTAARAYSDRCSTHSRSSSGRTS